MIHPGDLHEFRSAAAEFSRRTRAFAATRHAVGCFLHVYKGWRVHHSTDHVDRGTDGNCGHNLLAVMHLRRVRFPRDAANWRRFLFQACLNSVIPWTLLAFAERTLEAGLATILNSTSPIFAVLLSLGVSRREALSARKLFGVLAGMAGICLIVGVQALAGFGEQLIAQILTVVAALCYAGAALFGRGFKDLDPIAPAAGSLVCGAAILIPASLLIERPWVLAPSASSVLALIGLAAFSTALAFVIYFRLISTLGSVGTTAQAYLRVPIGVALAVVFLGERPSSTAWIGLACVVIGVGAMTIPAKKVVDATLRA
jgi:drug/metabolite transporter (DMT)-like permease